MQCLVDGDCLVYEIAFCAQYKDEETQEEKVREFEFVEELLLQRLKEIEEECWATEKSRIFLTANEYTIRVLNRKRKRQGLEPIEYKPNFRIEVAKSKPYKGNRVKEKPFHYKNIIAYMIDYLDAEVANGLEADDMLAIVQTDSAPLTTIICSRDKDLRQVEGMSFSWPCGKQEQFGPKRVDKLGELCYDEGRNKLTGTGIKFFYSQLITGDQVDNIPGLPRGGPSLAFKLLHDKGSESDMFRAVAERYEAKLGDDWEGYMKEQIDLLWMCREMDENGEPVRWKMS
jgi:5'-3' exonuclease